jgi:hypothetical protein
MWTAMPSLGLPFQPVGLVNRPMAAPALSAGLGGGIGGPSSTAQPLPAQAAPPTSIYGYGAPMAPGLLPALPSPGFAPAALLAAVAIQRGQPQGPNNDQDVEEFIYDALELIPGAADVEVRCENGRATLTGSVPHKRLKRDVGEIAWTIPSLQDVQNNVSIASRRRGRTPGRESETPAGGASPRKQG